MDERDERNEELKYRDAKCPVCGKNFIPAPLHVYRDKRGSKKVCSWTCVLESERLKNANQKNKERKLITKW